MKIEHLLKKMVERESSDLHLKVSAPAYARINSALVNITEEKILTDDMDGFMMDIMTRVQRTSLEEVGELDFAIGAGALGRFRVNAFRQKGSYAMAIRHVKAIAPSFSGLSLPDVILDLATQENGLVLITGTTGSGKSTCLASMVRHLNENYNRHILTIEDPIEFVHEDKNSVMTQRELGQDTKSYAYALKASLRQDPDVILVGEIRDLETFKIALTAADTGHLVMSTIHTTNASETLHRILAMYPEHQHDEVRQMLAASLNGIVSLRLVPDISGEGRIPAAEVLVNTGAIKEYIKEHDGFDMIKKAIAEGNDQYGSQTFDQSLYKHYMDENITYETALKYASNRSDFELKVRGIEGTSDRSWN
jgi:twitching motility protein PilT